MIVRATPRAGVLMLTALLWLTATAAEAVQPSATFRWSPAPGYPISHYEVWVSRSSTPPGFVYELDVPASDSPTATVEGEVGETLRIKVRAANAEETGPFSEPSAPVWLGLPPDLPPVGSPGVFYGRVDGADTARIYHRTASGDVLEYSVGPDAEPGAPPRVVGTEMDSSWQVAASGDFDGDGGADLFWRNSTSGQTRIWYLDADTYEEAAGPDHPGNIWVALSTGDFDGNGQDDIFWRSAVASTMAWLRIESDFAVNAFLNVPRMTWEFLAAGDFDGDGRDDLFWRDAETAKTTIWFMQGVENYVYAHFVESTSGGLDWEVFETYDEDGDGRQDVHWRKIESPDEMLWWWMEGAFASGVPHEPLAQP